MTKNERYSEMAEKALISFTKPVSEGGVTSFTEYGPFYEEYTAEKPTLVLNGMIFSLFGIMDFTRVFPDNKLAKKLYEEGISSLVNILPDFDLGFWSRYNLCKAEWYPHIDPATVGYQRLHIRQLEVMFQFSHNKTLKDYVEKFREQDSMFNIIKMYKLKYQTLKQLNRL